MELGNHYMDLKPLAYAVGSLIPAIVLGVHASKLAFAKTEEARQKLAAGCIYKLISSLYLAIVVGMIGYLLYAHFRSFH